VRTSLATDTNMLAALEPICSLSPSGVLESPQALAAMSTTLGIAISGVITLFVARKTMQTTERNAKLTILDRQHEALRSAVEKIVLLTYNKASILELEDVRAKCLVVLTLLTPTLDSHRALKEQLDLILLQQPSIDWGLKFLELSQRALTDSLIKRD
jgi:hypothetical protein